MKKIFISHSSIDADIAREVCRVLEEEGIECWIAGREKDIPPGERWE